LRFAIFLVKDLVGEGKERNMAGAFDRNCEGALMLCTCAGLATRADLVVFGDKTTQKLGVFVINGYRGVRTKLADPRAGIPNLMLRSWRSC
jgi:hypothetical protein